MKTFFLILLFTCSIALFSQTDSSKADTTGNPSFLELTIAPNIGVGLLRNNVAPVAGGNLMISLNNKYALDIGYSGYFFFNKDINGKNKMLVNSFIHKLRIFI